MKFPIEYFEENLIFNSSKNECWAIYKLDGFNYEFKSNETRINILNALSRFLANIGEEAKILIIPISQDIDSHYNKIIGKFNKKDILFGAAKGHADGTADYLKKKIERNGNANDYKVFVQTKLKLNNNIIKEIKDAVTYFIKEPMQNLEEIMGLDYKEVYEKDINEFLRMSNEYMKKQNRRLSLTKCDAMDLQWLIKRPFYRGIGEVKLRGDEENQWSPFVDRVIKNGKIAVRANKRETLSLTEGVVDVSEKKILKVSHGDGKESFQAFLSLAYIPDGITFPGNEWLLALQDYPIQTEICINISTVEHKESLKNISKKKKEIVDQIEHICKSDDEVPDELLDSKEYANMLEAELKVSRSPITNASITFCVFSDDREELNAKINFIKGYYEDSNFIIERSISDQLKLFMEFFPGTGMYVLDYIHRIPPRTLAGGMIGATRLLGDNQGPYIGTTGILAKNVFLDVSRACSLNRSASGGFFGTLGGGKSFSANLLFYLAVLYGGYGLILDPKGERENWAEDLPEFTGQINIITLSSDDEDKGKLDPFLIYKDNIQAAGDLAISILSELFKLDPKDNEYLVVLEAVEWVKQREKPCMIKLAERLLDFDEDDEFASVARVVGRKIKLLRKTAMAGLLFGKGDEEALNFDKRINILQIQNISMPPSTKPKEDYTQEEVLSTILMLPIASFARRFMHMDRSIFKIVLFDEAWALSATAQGNQMISTLVREGRALKAGCFFIAQSTRDMKGEGVQTNISYKFCFKTTEINEIKSVLEYMDLEITDENINELRNLRNGECLFQDLDGRVGKLKFDAVFSHLIDKAFNTNPDKVRKKKAGGDDEKAS